MNKSLDVMARYAKEQQPLDIYAEPLILYRTHVHDDWIDYNGHMNEAFSVFLTGYACDALAHLSGAMPKGAMFTAETHVSYHAEVPRGAALTLTGRMLSLWPKRWQMLYLLLLDGSDTPAVSIEQMSVYTENGKATTFPDVVYATLQEVLEAHQRQAPSPYAGRRVGDPRVKL